MQVLFVGVCLSLLHTFRETFGKGVFVHTEIWVLALLGGRSKKDDTTPLEKRTTGLRTKEFFSPNPRDTLRRPETSLVLDLGGLCAPSSDRRGGGGLLLVVAPSRARAPSWPVPSAGMQKVIALCRGGWKRVRIDQRSPGRCGSSAVRNKRVGARAVAWDGRWVACCHALGPRTAEGRGPDRVPNPLPRRFPMAHGAAIPGSAGSRTGAANGHVRAPTPAGGMSSRACQRAKRAGRGGAQ